MADVVDKLKGIFTRKTSYNSTTQAGTQAGAAGKGYQYQHLFERETDNLTYQEYRLIMKDTQVKVGLEILKYFLISKNYILTSNSDNPEDIEITEFITDALDNMEIPFREVLKNVLTAIPYGYSVQEIVYTLNDDNRIVPRALYPIHRRTIQQSPWVRDQYGELIAVHQQAPLGSTDIPAEKCLVYSFDKEFDEVEGQSILNNCKPIVEDKDDLMDWLMTFASRNENPLIYGKTKNELSRDNMLHIFDEIADGTTGVTIDLEDELGVLESQHRGETFFKALQYKDNQIFRRMFIGNLMLGDTSQTGSYAQINGQQDFMLYIMNGILSDVAVVFQKLINNLTNLNFGVTAKAPGFSFESFIDKDILGLLSALQPFVANGSFDSENQAFKELLAKAFMSQADIKMDLEGETAPVDEEDTFEYQPPLPGQSEAEQLIDEQLEGII